MGGFLPPPERRSTVLVAFYAAFSLLLLVVGERLPQEPLRGLGAWIFAPFDRTVLVVDRLGAAWHENQDLHRRITQLELENRRLRTAGTENQRLRAQFGLPQPHGLSLKPVEVLALSEDPIPSSGTLSAGARQGVRAGDVVVTEQGLVGRVGEVYPTLSRVILLSDPGTAVACEVESTGVLGVLRFVALPRPHLVLTWVPFADTVRVGQRVLTSGLSRRYPRGIPVGVVVRTGPDATGLAQEIEVKPAAELSRLRHAFIVPGPGQREDAP